MNRTPTFVAAVAFIVAVAFVSPAMATQVYQTSADFISETFSEHKPVAKAVWVTGDLKQRVAKVLGHDYRDIRVRYWTLEKRSAWILEEIGKVEPITLGVVVEDGHIEEVKVLTYRESRGFEIRFPFFMDQFRGARVDADNKLDRSIDGISGATLSVRATTKLARIALLLERHAENGVKRASVETQPKIP
jgi:Na+-translocating ferredoxin:NAD+ oxidoreductase RnfG subunit